MRVFKDDEGNAWELAITVGALRRVKAYLPGVDLLKIDEPDPSVQMPAGLSDEAQKKWEAPPLNLRLTIEPVLVCECICAILKPTLDAKGLGPDDFYDKMAGPGLYVGLAAFWEDLDHFFQSLGRDDLAQLAKVQRKLLAEIVSENRSAIEAWDQSRTPTTKPPNPSASTPGSSSTDSPASSASTPSPAP